MWTSDQPRDWSRCLMTMPYAGSVSGNPFLSICYRRPPWCWGMRWRRAGWPGEGLAVQCDYVASLFILGRGVPLRSASGLNQAGGSL
jgi:hypothetical protein